MMIPFVALLIVRRMDWDGLRVWDKRLVQSMKPEMMWMTGRRKRRRKRERMMRRRRPPSEQVVLVSRSQ